MTISFTQFIGMCEVYDPDVQGRSQITKQGEGGRVGRDRRKSEPERRRVKATGGGKSEPVSYKDRKDIGSQKQRSTKEQQPQSERGSAALSSREAQRKAYKERKARESKGSSPSSSKDKEKAASKLLTKKAPEKKVDPKYKPQKSSGLSRKERLKLVSAGERELKGIMKNQETDKYKKETGQNPDKKGRSTIVNRVQKRMNN